MAFSYNPSIEIEHLKRRSENQIFEAQQLLGREFKVIFCIEGHE